MFYGFKIQGKNYDKLERIINEIKKVVQKKTDVLYKELLEREIQVMVDEVALNVIQRPQTSILDESVQLLNRKIAVHIAKNLNTEYNFASALNIFYYNKDMYLEFSSRNPLLAQSVLGIKDLLDYSVEEIDDFNVDDITNKMRSDTWTEIINKYKNSSVMMIKISPLNAYKIPAFEDMHFDEPEKRADILARHRLTNNYLSLYAGGGEIPNHKLMEYLDQAMLKLTNEESGRILRSYKTDLMRIIPEITKDIVCPSENIVEPEKPNEIVTEVNSPESTKFDSNVVGECEEISKSETRNSDTVATDINDVTNTNANTSVDDILSELIDRATDDFDNNNNSD